jgi:hypothetical protein
LRGASWPSNAGAAIRRRPIFSSRRSNTSGRSVSIIFNIWDFNVWTARKRAEKLRYMHRNPVERGLVESPEEWRWSSFRAYFMGEAGPVAVDRWDVLKMKIRAPAV